MSVRAMLEQQLGTAYRIERELGGGGMSHVFLAEEVALGRRVVVKVLPPDASASVDAERFRREIQLAASLQHPHIVPLLSAGASGQLLWYSMPFVEGDSLRARLVREHELPVDAAVRVFRDLLDALSYAHGRGVVHRDIKPENILVSGRHAVVTDFGVAKAISAATGGETMTATGLALGTPAYMAPEQATGDPSLDHRADIYAAGLVMYEMLAGRAPFEGLSPSQMMAAHATRPPQPLGEVRAAVPAPLAALVMRCLEKRAADRPQTAEEALTALESVVTPTVTTPMGALAPAGAPATSRRRWKPAALIGTPLLAAGAIALLATRGPAEPDRVGADPNDTTVRAIVVIDFETAPGDERIGVGTKETIRAAILMSNRLFTLTRTNETEWLRWALDVEPGERPNPDSMMEALSRVGVHAVIRGQITQVGPSFVFSVDAIPMDGQSPRIEPFTATAQDSTTLVRTVEELATTIVAGLERSAPGMVRPKVYGLATSGSLEALRLYQEATRIGWGVRADWGAAVQLVREAVRVDSTFAPAWRRLAVSLYNTGVRRDEATRAATRAYAERGHVKSWERTMIEGSYFNQLDDWQQAISAYAPGVSRGDGNAMHNTALSYANLGEHRIGERFAARAREGATGFGNTSALHARLLMSLGRMREADSIIAWGDSVSPTSRFVEQSRSSLQVARRDYDALRSLLPALAPSDTAPAASGTRLSFARRQRTLNAIEGRIAETRRATESAITATLAFESPADAAAERIEQLRIEASAGGDPRALSERLRTLLRENPLAAMPPLDRPYGAAFFTWMTLGDAAEAERVLATWDGEMTGRYATLDASDRRLAHGDLALARGRAEEALRTYRAGQLRACGTCLLPRIARAFESREQADSAIAAYEGYLAATSPFQDLYDAHELARTYRRLGELYEAKGDTRRAILRYEGFVRLWKDADPELQPQVEQVRAKVADLQRKIG